mmetsp:Transcript_125350/g.366157  ORF Transcript_125350/g.366157 Transcript_125350/m.366157 type:complete len:280 (-) Transcript_125350:56-895(-)
MILSLQHPMTVARRALPGEASRARRTRNLRCVLLAVALCALTTRQPAATIEPQTFLVPRAAALRGAVAWAAALASWPQAAWAKEKWARDIVRAVDGLKAYQQQWSTLNAEGQATKGANRVREGLTIRYTDVIKINVPPGEPLGVNVNSCQVASVSNPKPGWEEGDVITAVNGRRVLGSDADLAEALALAKSEGKVEVTLERVGPPLLDNLESKLKDTYLSLADDSLPELEEVQISVGEMKGTAAMAASATDASPETMRRLKVDIDKLIGLLTPFAKALQ